VPGSAVFSVGFLWVPALSTGLVGILWGADGVLATCLSVLVMIYGSTPCAAQLSRNVPGSASPAGSGTTQIADYELLTAAHNLSVVRCRIANSARWQQPWRSSAVDARSADPARDE
jgi:hypothetical protein